MKNLALVLTLAFAFNSHAFDMGKMKDKAKAAAQQKAEDKKNETVGAAQNIMAVCKDEIGSIEACKHHQTPDTVKTCLVAHKEQLSQGCKSSLGL